MPKRPRRPLWARAQGKRIGVIGLATWIQGRQRLRRPGHGRLRLRSVHSVEHAWVLSREVQRVGTLEDLCRGCDYLTVHVPSKADTIGMISTEQINLLAPDAVLINYARETTIDEDAVDAALREGKLSWFSCDFATPKTVKMPNTFITTHSGAGTGEAEPTAPTWPSASSRITWKTAISRTASTTPPAAWARRAPQAALPALHANVAQHDRPDHGHSRQGQRPTCSA